MTESPHTILSCASSLDGRIDGTGPERLVLSSRADLDRVDAERAGCDAILIGAGTLRRDNPRLRVSPRRGAERAERGLPADPLPVVLTRSGRLPSDRVLWNGDRRALVYCPPAAAPGLRRRLGDRAEVAELAAGPEPGAVLADLGGRGVRRLFVEGGQHIHTAFLAAGMADEIQLSIAPLIVGEAGAPRFVGSGSFPQSGRRLQLLETRVLEDSVLLTYRCHRAGDREAAA
ncbi:RibD family protein [Streptomyces sp. NPDC059740]|uniref:RibD family protein n=1 Tax=Streptomyces sp. NPDC059740 TaxID=3346926 RepID=UPI003659A893